MNPILVVDDEKAIANLICHILRDAGYECEMATSGAKAADMIEEKAYELVLLDIMMPEIDGYDLLEYIGPLGTPVIFVTAKDDTADRVKGLRMGADDYIVKPFEPEELVARVESVLRRANRGDQTLSACGVECDMATHRVTAGKEEVLLTPKEFELLVALIQNKGIILSREYLNERIWGEYDEVETRTLDTHIQRLRKKLGWEKSIRTLYKVGYILEDAR